MNVDHHAVAVAHAQGGRWAEAAAAASSGLVTQPQHPGLLAIKAVALLQLKQFGAAEPLFQAALAQQPANPEFHNNYGVLLRATERLHESYAEFATAVALKPRYKEALKNLAFMAWQVGHYKQALSSFATYVALNPVDKPVYFHMAELALGLGNLRDGWRLYQMRPNKAERAQHFHTPDLVYPLPPLPERLDGQTAVLLPEQGLGDILFFLRYAPMLKARGAKVGYGAAPNIARFVGEAESIDEVLDSKTVVPYLGKPYTFFSGDLPFLTAEDDSYPPSLRFSPLPERVAAARAHLAQLGPPPYVGVNWRAGVKSAADDNLLYKSLPAKALGEALRGIEATVVSLQRLPQDGEHAEFESGIGRSIPDLSSVQADLETLMGYLAVIDEIVGVSSTSVHLRAAMGLDAKVLFVTPTEWRWLLEGDTSPWFPDCKVYRAHRPALREPALANLQRDLAISVAEHRKRYG